MSAAISPTWSGRAAAAAIVAYQRYLSRYKGFRCAHRALHGGPSCSEFGRRVVLRRGLLALLSLLPMRFRACGQASRVLHQRRVLDYRSAPPPAPPKQDDSRWAATPDECCGSAAKPCDGGDVAYAAADCGCQVLSGLICQP